jgi:hypothetical protein
VVSIHRPPGYATDFVSSVELFHEDLISSRYVQPGALPLRHLARESAMKIPERMYMLRYSWEIRAKKKKKKKKPPQKKKTKKKKKKGHTKQKKKMEKNILARGGFDPPTSGL